MYVSKVLTQPEKNYSVTDRELLAILFAIRKFRCYIEGSHFLVESDHRALKYLQSLKEPSGRLARWLFELQQYDFEISHKPGSQQVVADMLSRNVDLPEDEIAAFKEIKDKWYVERMEQVISRPKKFKDWRVMDGMLYKYTTDELLNPLYSREESWSW